MTPGAAPAITEPRLEPECRTCEDWGTVVIDDHGRLREFACPTHVGTAPIPASAQVAQ